MRVRNRFVVMLLFLLGVMLSLGLLEFAVTGQDVPGKSAKPSTGTTLRTLGDVLGSMDQATVSDEFIVSLYTNDQVEKNRHEKAANNQRHEEFAAKQRLLEKRSKEINSKLPKNFTGLLSYSDVLITRYDRDGDRILEGEEIKRCKAADNNADSRVNKLELIHWLLTQPPFFRPGRDEGKARLTVGEVEELMAQQAAVQGLVDKLTKDYEDALQPSKPTAYYLIVEASSEFLRLRNDTEEQIIPYASIRKFRRSLPH